MSGYDNPYNRYRGAGKQAQTEVFRATTPSSTRDQERRIESNTQLPTKVSLPDHLFIPKGAQSIDARNLIEITPSVDQNLFTFTTGQGQFVRWIAYGLFNDALNFNNTQFKPTLNGSRIFPYHGNPNADFRISLGLAPDLSNNSLIPCQLLQKPNETLQWLIDNADVVNVTMGVRMVGYFVPPDDAVSDRVLG